MSLLTAHYGFGVGLSWISQWWMKTRKILSGVIIASICTTDKKLQKKPLKQAWQHTQTHTTLACFLIDNKYLWKNSQLILQACVCKMKIEAEIPFQFKECSRKGQWRLVRGWSELKGIYIQRQCVPGGSAYQSVHRNITKNWHKQQICGLSMGMCSICRSQFLLT